MESTQTAMPETIQKGKVLKATWAQCDKISPFIHAARVYEFLSHTLGIKHRWWMLALQEKLSDVENSISEQSQVTDVSNSAHVVLISDDMFANQGPYRVTDQHLNIEVAVYAQMNTANKVCIKLQLKESR